MELHGHAKVMLFDAKTGVMTDCVESDNIVTNFFDEVFNTAYKVLATYRADNTWSMSLAFFNNVYKDLFGGVMIFSEALEESVDHVYPSVDEMRLMIGNGNQDVTIEGSSFKGSINVDECVVGDNYVTFVWDFSTSQCNGDIASICLTSDRGGHLGCRFDAKDASHKCRSSFLSVYSNNIFYNIGSEPSAVSMYRGLLGVTGMVNGDGNIFVEREDKCYNRSMSGIYKVADKPDKFEELSISLIAGRDRPSIACSESTVEAAAGDRTYSVDGETVYAAAGGSTVWSVYKFSDDLSTFTKFDIPVTNINATNKEFTGSNIATYARRHIYKDKIILMSGAALRSSISYSGIIRVYIMNFDGSFIYKDNPISDKLANLLWGANGVNVTDGRVDSFGSLISIGDKLFLVSSKDNYGRPYCYLDVETGEIDFTPIFNSSFDPGDGHTIKNRFGLKPPYYTASVFGLCGGGGVVTDAICINTQYLATINNMDAVLTKDPTKTMKIVYTLTQVD